MIKRKRENKRERPNRMKTEILIKFVSLLAVEATKGKGRYDCEDPD